MVFLSSLPSQTLGSSAVQIVLGGSWFSKSNLGTSSGYMMSEMREKAFDSRTTRIAVDLCKPGEVSRDLLVLAVIHIMEFSPYSNISLQVFQRTEV